MPTVKPRPRINSMTAIVWSFFENMSKKSKSSGNHLQHSAELEDSGFQVEDSQDKLSECILMITHCLLMQSPQAGVLNDI